MALAVRQSERFPRLIAGWWMSDSLVSVLDDLIDALRLRRELGDRVAEINPEVWGEFLSGPTPKPAPVSVASSAVRQVSPSPASHAGRSAPVAAADGKLNDLMFITDLPLKENESSLLLKMIGTMALGYEAAEVPVVNAPVMPSDEESVQRCRSFLREQIQVCRPRVIVLLGEELARAIVPGIQLGAWGGSAKYPVVAIKHPREILRWGESPTARRFKRDVCLVFKAILIALHRPIPDCLAKVR